jgi:transcriptional regulator with XRE-family HTH domain
VNTTSVFELLANKFSEKEYRDAFIAEQIFSRLPLKIRGIRESQELTQRQLGELAGMAQTWISKLEDPNYGKLTIATLLKIASAFDVGLQIDFVPFSRILNEAMRLSAKSFYVPSFAEDPGFSSDLAVKDVSAATPGADTGNLIVFPHQDTGAPDEDAFVPPGSAVRAAQQQFA